MQASKTKLNTFLVLCKRVIAMTECDLVFPFSRQRWPPTKGMKTVLPDSAHSSSSSSSSSLKVKFS